MAKIDILRFVHLADLSNKQKAELRKSLQERQKTLLNATKKINQALAQLSKRPKKGKKAKKRKTER